MREVTKQVYTALLNDEYARIAATEGKEAARKATYFDVVWAMRERAMDARQRKRDRRFERFRPILTLGGDGIEMMRSYIHEDDPAFALDHNGPDFYPSFCDPLEDQDG